MLGGVKRQVSIAAAHLLAQVVGDKLAVEAAILDKYLAGTRAGDDDAGNIHTRNIRFQALRIADGTKLFVRKLDADAAQKIVVGMVSGESKYEIILQSHGAFRRFQHYAIFIDLANCAIEV